MYLNEKAVIDGDLCEKFSSLDVNKQKTIAEELDRTPIEVILLKIKICLFLINLAIKKNLSRYQRDWKT